MMSSIKEWFISGGIHLVIGFLIGWVVFKRPQWVENLIGSAETKVKDEIKSKL